MLWFGLVLAWFPWGTQAAFSDVLSTHPHRLAIDYVEAEGIVGGYPDGTFGPDNTVNRVELLKIVLEANPVVAECAAVEFSDVPGATWYGEYLQNAVCREVVRGYDDGTFRPGQAVLFTEAAKILANVYAQDAIQTTGVWYEGYAQALAELNAIPRELRRFDGELTRGQLAEMIYRLETQDQSQPSLSWNELKTQTEQAPREPETGGPLSLPKDPAVSTPLPPAQPPAPNFDIPISAIADPFDFLPGLTSAAIKQLNDLEPRRLGSQYYLVNRGNVWLWWTQEGVFPSRTILLVEGDSTPQHVRGLWQHLRGSTLKDVIIASVPPGNDEAQVGAGKLPPVLSEVVEQHYGGSFDFKAGTHAHAQLILDGAMKTHFELLSLPLSDLYLTVGRELPPFDQSTVASGGLEENKKSGNFKEALKPTNYIEITHQGVWTEPLDIAGLELTDTTVYYDDSNTFGLWGVGPFEGVMSTFFYQGPLVKSKDPAEYAAAQLGFGAAEMTLPLYLKFMVAYQSRLPGGSVFQYLDSAKQASLSAMQAGLNALPLEVITVRQPKLQNFSFKSGDKFPGLDKFNLVALGPLAQSKDNTSGPLFRLTGDGIVLGEKMGDFDLTMTERKTEAKAQGSLGISLGSVSGQSLGTLGSSVALELLADAQTNRLKLKGAFSAGPLVSQPLAIDLRADNFTYSAPSSCAFPFQLKATAAPTRTLGELNFTPSASLPDPAQLLSCPEDIYFVIKNGVTYAFNRGVALAELANSYLPENEVTRIGIEGLKFAGGAVIEAPEEILNLAKQVPGVGELIELQNKIADEAKKAAEEAARQAAEEARKAAEKAAQEAAKAAQEAARAAERALNESLKQFDNFISNPGDTIKSVGGFVSSVGGAIGGLFGGGGGSSIPGFGWVGPYQNIKAIDIGVGHHREPKTLKQRVWLVSETGYPLQADDVGGGGFYFYYRNAGLGSNFPGFVRIDVDQDGYPSAIDKKGRLWTYNGSRWNLTSTYALDVGIGGGYIWIISTEAQWGSYRIYRAPYSAGRTNFKWKYMGGAGTKIDVGKDGRAWAINKAFEVWEWKNNQWSNRHGRAIDIAVSESNRAWVLSAADYNFGHGGGRIYTYETCHWNGFLNRCMTEVPAAWVATAGFAHTIGAGWGPLVWAVNSGDNVYLGTGRR